MLLAVQPTTSSTPNNLPILPGLIGFTPPLGTPDSVADEVLNKLQRSLVHHRNHQIGETVRSNRARTHLLATRVFNRQLEPGFFCSGGRSVWLDGEWYNTSDVARSSGLEAGSAPTVLHGLFESGQISEGLAGVDGIYSAAVFDEQKKQLHLIVDRYGMRQLCWTRFGSNFAWSSEAKAFMHIPGFDAKLDRESLSAFLRLGYLLEDRTWLEGVQRIGPAGWLTFDLESRQVAKTDYWSWPTASCPIGERDGLTDLAEELGERFTRAVEDRCLGSRLGINLSGGLDSRAVLAAVPMNVAELTAVTFGKKGSDEINLAGMSAARRGATQHVHEIDSDNWLRSRVRGVWLTDGQLDLQHMHGSERDLSDLMRVALNGAGGDGVVGGGHLFEAEELDQYAGSTFGLGDHNEDLLQRFEAEYRRAGSSHALYVSSRMRAFTYQGLRLGIASGIDYRLPFLANEFQELLFTVPLRLRKKNRLYRQILLSTFPGYFSNIPWQSTGQPLSWPRWTNRAARFLRRVRGRWSSGESSGLDYAEWIRLDPARRLFSELLDTPDAVYGNYLQQEKVVRIWKAHLEGEDRTTELCRYLTLELWLQQLFQGKWKELPPGP